MIISTSSHNVPLTDELCEYVEDTLHKAFGQTADRVVSVDVRLDAFHGVRKPGDAGVSVRVDLRNHGALVTETRDGDLHTAIRRGAADSARAVDRLKQHARGSTRQRRPGKRLAFRRYSVANA